MTQGSDRVQVALEEYRTLRQEILNSITAQYQILTIGAGAVGLLATAVLGQDSDGAGAATADARAQTLFDLGGLLVGIPLLCLLVVVMWMNEVNRMLRAGRFLLDVEQVLNDLVALPGLLSWESRAHLDDMPDVERSQFRLVRLFFGTLAAAFVGLGLYRLWNERLPLAVEVVVTVGVVVVLVAAALLLRSIGRQYVRVRAAWERAPQP